MAFNKNFNNRNCCSSFPKEWNDDDKCKKDENCCQGWEQDEVNCSCPCRWCQERNSEREDAFEGRKSCREKYYYFDDEKYDEKKDCQYSKHDCDNKREEKKYGCGNEHGKDCEHEWEGKDDCSRGRRGCRRGCFCIRFF